MEQREKTGIDRVDVIEGEKEKLELKELMKKTKTFCLLFDLLLIVFIFLLVFVTVERTKAWVGPRREQHTEKREKAIITHRYHITITNC
jgi:hypothetical protein